MLVGFISRRLTGSGGWCIESLGKSTSDSHTFSQTATSKQDQYKANGIMNNAFSDYPAESPYTSSFIGSNSSVFDPHLDQDVYTANRPPKASYLYKEKPVEPPYVYRNEAPRRPTTISTSASTVGFLPPKKKQRSIRGKTCVLLLLLLCFIILSIVMIVLYARKNEQGNAGKTNGNSQPVVSKHVLLCRTSHCARYRL